MNTRIYTSHKMELAFLSGYFKYGYKGKITRAKIALKNQFGKSLKYNRTIINMYISNERIKNHARKNSIFKTRKIENEK